MLLFGVTLVLSSCQKDDDIYLQESKTQETNLNVSIFRKKQLEKNSNLMRVINKTEKVVSKNKANKTVYNSYYDFTINTSYAKVIESNGLKNYTFGVYRTEDNGLLENLVLKEQADSTFRVLLVQYNITDAEKNNLINKQIVDIENKIIFVELHDISGSLFNKVNSDQEICTVFSYDWEQGSTCSAGDNHSYTAGDDCSGWGNPDLTATSGGWILSASEISCDGGGGSTPSPSSPSEGSGGSGTYVPPTTTPVLCPRCPEIEIDQEEDCSLNATVPEQLNCLIFDNPYLLLEIDCNQIQSWQTLSQHTAPPSVQNKINGLPSSLTNDFEIQALSDASGTMVNLDYFSVNVTNLPNNPNSNTQFTADELLDHIRINFNNFVDGSTFDPYCEISSMCQTETDLWNSNNPLGSIIYIDIPFDDGVVVCTEYSNNYWYFMTMNSPYAGNHPVSGTRQFGYEQNLDGSYNFFVRGVDRFDSNIVENVSYGLDGFDNAFQGADDLWSSFQERLNNFINNPINGGSATISTPTKNRPDWNKVQEVLNGERPISDLGCE